MHFITRSPEPQILQENRKKWTDIWCDFHSLSKEERMKKNKKKPTEHWRKNEIRKPLVADFESNCGYCGKTTYTHPEEDIPKADVDHYRPKSDFPKLTYDWNNLIWSCKECNSKKSKFFDKIYPILNPCNREDTDTLVFVEETGHYQVSRQHPEYSNYVKRLDQTQKKTMIHSPKLCDQRRFAVNSLKTDLNSFLLNFSALSILPSDTKEKWKENLQMQQKKIREMLELPGFKKLIRKTYTEQLQKHPELKELLQISL